MKAEENAIVVRDDSVQLGSLQTAGPAQIIARATEVANELSAIIEKKHLFALISNKKFVVVEGWSTLGAMLGVLPREMPELTKRNDDGSYTATVELIRTSDGAVIGRASSLVGMDEKDRYGKPTWANRDEYARRSMAITRATGKAYRLGFAWIMTLAGYQGTPAEEMPVDAEFEEMKPAKSNGRTIKDAFIEATIPVQFDNLFEAKNALKKSNLKDQPTKDQVVDWAKRYRAWRDSGLDSDPAAEKANAGLSPK